MTTKTTRARTALTILAAAGAVAALSACSSKPQLGTCDDPKIQAGLKSGLEQSTKQPIASISNVVTVSKTDTSATCKMHITATDGEEADIGYKLTLDGTNTKYETTDVNQTKGATAAPAAAASDQAAPAGGDDAKQ
jgi:hypothetical protein